MNQLTTNPKSHVIITFTKSHHFITQAQHDALITMGVNAQIIVDGNPIKTNNIAEIISVEKYYETFPEKRKTNYGQPYTQLPGDVYSRAGKNGKASFLKGLRRTSPNNTILRDIEQGKGTSSKEEYNPKFVFDPDKETWEEFQARSNK